MRRKHIAWGMVALIVLLYLNNCSWLVRTNDGHPWLLAHRGLAQCFPMTGITAQTNTARRIYPPDHPYLENSLPSMEAAFKAGADMVEFDVQLTKDRQLAVFHDADLSYRTDGTGPVRDYTMAQLKKFDIGYGYTADNGKTYPFRGKGIGLMPSITEVLNTFPDGSFLIHVKCNDAEEGKLLAEYLLKLSDERLDRFAFYGGDKPMAELKHKMPDSRVMSYSIVKKAMLSYMLVGWTGYVPPSMHGAFFYMPMKYARFLWGWPNRFIQRMNAAGTMFILVDGDGKWSEGFDNANDLKQIPRGYDGGIWSDRIDLIAPLVKSQP